MGTDMYSHVQTLNNSFTSLSSQYGDFNSYQQIDPFYNQTTGLWNPVYTASPDEWSVYSQSSSFPGSNHATENDSLSYFDSNGIPPPSTTETLSTLLSPPVVQYSNDSQRRKPDWVRCSVSPSQSGGRTRTKDKYRVVYSDEQRMELEKEFQSNRYITIGRKSEMALGLCLSERQVKIWFQNRRAKERKLDRKKLQLAQQASMTSLTPSPELAATDNVSIATSLTQINMSETISMTHKKEY